MNEKEKQIAEALLDRLIRTSVDPESHATAYCMLMQGALYRIQLEKAANEKDQNTKTQPPSHKETNP